MSNDRKPLFVASLKADSPFREIFPGGVPVKGWNEHEVQLEGDPETRAYFVDWLFVSDKQRILLAETITRLRGGHAGEFIEYMNRGGELPLRVSQTMGVSGDLRAFV